MVLGSQVQVWALCCHGGEAVHLGARAHRLPCSTRNVTPRDGPRQDDQDTGDIINSEATEILCRRLHGLELAFAHVRRMADWKQPRGQSGAKWKSKVRWELCDQYDIRALDEDGLYIPGADEEVRSRLEKKALFKKYLEKAGETGQHEE